MKTRLSLLVGALVAMVVGMAALRRSARREVPIRPGTWEPAGTLPDAQ